jgi:N-acetylmuramic acid 6-phosphate etherase
MLTSSTIQETAGTQANGIKKDQASLLQHLTTESQNEASQGFDTKSALEIARIINHEDAKVAAAVKKRFPRSRRSSTRWPAVSSRWRNGSSISAPVPADASLPSTPPSAPRLTQQLPDRCNTSWPAAPRRWPRPLRSTRIQKSLASATSPVAAPPAKMLWSGFLLRAEPPMSLQRVAYARARGAHTAAVTCNHDTPLAAAADIAIVAEVGPEVVSGSTRMKAGSAQKMVLNMITTGAMTRLGYVYENLMVNVHMQNSKLVERGIRILMKRLQDRPRDRGADHQERRPQRSGSPGHAES